MRIRATLILALTLSCLVCSARQYKIVHMHNVELRNATTNQLLETNVTYDTKNGKIVEKWLSKDAYYDFFDIPTGQTEVVREAKVTSSNDSWFDRLLSLVFGMKMCSTRAADNELFGGLDKYLSQTFYLSFGNKLHSEIFVASNLKQDDNCYFKLQIANLKNGREIRLAPSRGFRVAAEDLRGVVKSGELSRLRCRVTYVAEDGDEVVVTDSMNIVFLP